MAKRFSEISSDIIYGVVLRGISILASMGIIPLMTKLVDKATLGLWFTVLGVLQWASMMDFGLSSGVRNKVAQLRVLNRDNRSVQISNYVGNAFFTLAIIVFFVLIIIAFLLRFVPLGLIFNGYNKAAIDSITYILLFCFFGVGVNVVLTLSSQVLAAYEKPIYMSLLGCISTIGYALWVVLCCIFNVKGVFVLASGYIITLIFSGLVVTYKMYRVMIDFEEEKPDKFCFDISIIKGFGLRFFVIQAGAIIVYTLPKLLISYKLGTEHVVNYEIAQKIVMVGIVFFTIILNSIWSSFTIAWHSKDISWIRSILKRLNYLMIAVLLGAIIYSTTAKYIISLWMGDGFLSDSYLYVFFGVYFALTTWSNIYGCFLNGISDTKLQMITMFLSIIILIPSSFIFMNMIGDAGPIAATCLAMLPFAIVSPLYVYKKLSIIKI